MQDVIQREVMIHATQQSVYAAISDPEQLVKWFPETIEGDYQPGKQVIFGFGHQHKTQVYVEAAKPHTYFAFRWIPGANQFLGDVHSVPNTLVEFRISKESEKSCKVTLTESGFADLPTAMMADAFKQNSGGWEFMMNRLGQLFSN